MAVLKIYDVNQPCLRTKCKKVSRVTPSEKKLLEDMVETMRAAHGIGLAAPQVGVGARLIVVEVEEILYTLANPEVTETSEETDIMREGCLSLPDYYGPVERPIRATIRGQDQNGKRVKIKADGLLARAFQHEIDHLDGILFFDPQRMRSLSDLRYEPPGSDEESEPEETPAASLPIDNLKATAAGPVPSGRLPERAPEGVAGGVSEGAAGQALTAPSQETR